MASRLAVVAVDAESLDTAGLHAALRNGAGLGVVDPATAGKGTAP